jgi:hypothetical protein
MAMVTTDSLLEERGSISVGPSNGGFLVKFRSPFKIGARIGGLLKNRRFA